MPISRTSLIVSERNKDMPISNTVNARPRFREIGKIKKGVVVLSKNNKPRPKEVDYLVVDFNPEETEAMKTFFSHYPERPMFVRIRAPFNEVSEWWDAWYKAFKGTRMIAKAGLNVQLANEHGLDPLETMFFERLFDAEYNCWVVKSWKTLDVEHPDCRAKWGLDAKSIGGPLVVNMNENIDHRNGEPLGPVIYKTVSEQTKKETKYFLQPTGTMSIAVTELIPFMGFMSLHTTGKVDINNISGELAGIEMRAKQAGIPLPQVPMILYRRKEAVRDPDGNKTYHWNFHVGIDPEYSARMAMIQQAQIDGFFGLGSGPDAQKVLPSKVDIVDVDDDEYFDSLPDDDGDDGVIDIDLADGDELVISNYKDFWQYAEGLGLDMKAEGVSVNDIWKELQNDIPKAVVAVNKLAGKE